jgi:hypothetical protein
MSKFPEDDAELVEQSFARHIARNQDEPGYLSECSLNWFYCVNSCIVMLLLRWAYRHRFKFAGKAAFANRRAVIGVAQGVSHCHLFVSNSYRALDANPVFYGGTVEAEGAISPSPTLSSP